MKKKWQSSMFMYYNLYIKSQNSEIKSHTYIVYFLCWKQASRVLSLSQFLLANILKAYPVEGEQCVSTDAIWVTEGYVSRQMKASIVRVVHRSRGWESEQALKAAKATIIPALQALPFNTQVSHGGKVEKKKKKIQNIKTIMSSADIYESWRLPVLCW